MKAILSVLLVLYLLGAVGTFWMHTQMPVTFGLALLRSVVWPIWVTTGRPHGRLTGAIAHEIERYARSALAKDASPHG